MGCCFGKESAPQAYVGGRPTKSNHTKNRRSYGDDAAAGVVAGVIDGVSSATSGGGGGGGGGCGVVGWRSLLNF